MEVFRSSLLTEYGICAVIQSYNTAQAEYPTPGQPYTKCRMYTVHLKTADLPETGKPADENRL